MKFSLYIGTNRYSLSTEDDILKLYPELIRSYFKKPLLNIIRITPKKKLRVTIARLMKAKNKH